MMSNPIILAVDTSSSVAGIAIGSGPKVIASMTLNSGRPHSQELFPAIMELCRLSAIDLGRVDLLGAVTGPGSFTGLRVGLSAIKGLADSLGKPALGRNALDLLAMTTGKPGLHLVMINAGRGEFYCGLRRIDVQGQIESLAEDRVCPPAIYYVYIEDTILRPAQAGPPIVLLDCDQSEGLETQFLSGWRAGWRAGWRETEAGPILVRRDRVNLAAFLSLSLLGTPAPGDPAKVLNAYYVRPSDAEIKSCVS